MLRYRSAVPFVALGVALIASVGCDSAPRPEPAADAGFAALQERGAEGMGVDQYASTHVFDALPDGGRIEYQFDSDDPAGVAQIRSHLQEIRVAFEAGDFSIPAFVHDQEVPGTAVMAERREHIEYHYRELPRGGELRLVTQDPQALAAIRAFMAFQREDHRAGGVDHATMDHGAMDHGTMEHGATDHDAMDDATMDHGAMDHDAMDHGTAKASSTDQSSLDQQAAGRTQHHLAMGGGDAAFAADMNLVHELVMNNQAITRVVELLPNGIRTLTQSSDPTIAGYITAHVASMEQRLREGEVFNLFSPTLPMLFENYDRIHSEFEHTPTGVAVVQTSDDPALVEALQAHAAEVSELVDEGMMAMMRGMMNGGMHGMMGQGMHGSGGMHQAPTP
jgi:hypothetical protein